MLIYKEVGEGDEVVRALACAAGKRPTEKCTIPRESQAHNKEKSFWVGSKRTSLEFSVWSTSFPSLFFCW